MSLSLFGIVPSLRCKGSCCFWQIFLPLSAVVPYERDDDTLYPTQEEIDEHRSRWPPDGWLAAIGCPNCGNIHEYDESDVEWCEEEAGGPDTYSSGVVCYHVSTACAKADCRALAQFHIVVGEDQDASENALRDRLHAGLYNGKCPNGHDLLPIPKERYGVTKVVGEIPSDA
jgi:hypothetical protein